MDILLLGGGVFLGAAIVDTEWTLRLRERGKLARGREAGLVAQARA